MLVRLRAVSCRGFGLLDLWDSLDKICGLKVGSLKFIVWIIGLGDKIGGKIVDSMCVEVDSLNLIWDHIWLVGLAKCVI